MCVCGCEAVRAQEEPSGSLVMQQVGLHSVSLEAHVPKTNQRPSVVSFVKENYYFLKVLDINRSINQIIM